MSLRPVRLSPDNFTPPARTPWGGRRIRERYKAGLGLADGPPVGESWEISVEPSFPSRIADGGSLAEAIAADPVGWLGPAIARRHGQTPLLVKLLDAADDLSLQVHPADDDPALASSESGKPEAWVVLEAEPNAGLYLGFREGVDRRDVERCIADEGALDALMNFVPVRPGDAFIIDAGTPHAIGRGLTLLEPQFVSPGRRGVTYRYWDWNRRYDAEGRLDPNGAPRELHLARSLAVTRWDAARGEAFVEACRSPARPLAGRERVIDGAWFVVDRWSGNLDQRLAIDTLVGIVCVGGRLTIDDGVAPLTLCVGESAVIPAATAEVGLYGEDAVAFSVSSPVEQRREIPRS